MPPDDMLTILHPAAEGAIPEERPHPRLAQLQGATVGLIDNSRHNSDRFMDNLKVLLGEEGVDTVIVRKANPSIPMDPSKMDDLLAQCDAVVHGVAD